MAKFIIHDDELLEWIKILEESTIEIRDRDYLINIWQIIRRQHDKTNREA